MQDADVFSAGVGDGGGDAPADAIAEAEGVELVDGAFDEFAVADEVDVEFLWGRGIEATIVARADETHGSFSWFVGGWDLPGALGVEAGVGGRSEEGPNV